MTPSDFDNHFLKKLDQLGSHTLHQYKDAIETYKNQIVPFEIRRMKENQNLSFKNTSLEKDKN